MEGVLCTRGKTSVALLHCLHMVCSNQARNTPIGSDVFAPIFTDIPSYLSGVRRQTQSSRNRFLLEAQRPARLGWGKNVSQSPVPALIGRASAPSTTDVAVRHAVAHLNAVPDWINQDALPRLLVFRLRVYFEYRVRTITAGDIRGWYYAPYGVLALCTL